MNEDNYAEVVDPATGRSAYALELDAEGEDLAVLKEAADACPTSAITVYHIESK